jgi:molecular chaperone DnaK (HSP70)
MQVSRDTLEALGEDLYPRVAVPVTTALQQAQLTMENISHFIVVGGGIR